MKPENVCRNLLAESIAEHVFKSKVNTQSQLEKDTVTQDGLDSDILLMLDDLNLQYLIPIFFNKQMKIEELAELTSDNLHKMGIYNESERKEILKESNKIVRQKINQSKRTTYKTCIKGHQLHLVTNLWTCSECNNSVEDDDTYPTKVWRCDGFFSGSCDYELCISCMEEKDNSAICKCGDQLYIIEDSWFCDVCRFSSIRNHQEGKPRVSVWRCHNDKRTLKGGSCAYDLCINCVNDSRYF